MLDACCSYFEQICHTTRSGGAEGALTILAHKGNQLVKNRQTVLTICHALATLASPVPSSLDAKQLCMVPLIFLAIEKREQSLITGHIALVDTSPPTFSHTLNAKPLKCFLGKLQRPFIQIAQKFIRSGTPYNQVLQSICTQKQLLITLGGELEGAAYQLPFAKNNYNKMTRKVWACKAVQSQLPRDPANNQLYDVIYLIRT